MQDKYVGDIGDFGKYCLLRALSGNGKRQLGVVWYFVNGDRTMNNDGKHIRYLGVDKDSEGNFIDFPQRAKLKLRQVNQGVYDGLKTIVLESRVVAAIEAHDSEVLPTGTKYYRQPVPVGERDDWLSEAIAETKGAQIVFLDPDNGLARSSLHVKHVLHDDLRKFWDCDGGRVLVLYHHPSRNGTHDVQIRNLKSEIERDVLEGRSVTVLPLRYRRGTSRAYFVIVPTSERDKWQGILNEFLLDWRMHETKSWAFSDAS